MGKASCTPSQLLLIPSFIFIIYKVITSVIITRSTLTLQSPYPVRARTQSNIKDGLFAGIVNDCQSLIIFVKSFILDLWLSSKYVPPSFMFICFNIDLFRLQTRSSNNHKLWGQETVPTAKNGELAYHYFKPSHLEPENVVVTHRHFGNRTSSM